MNKKRVIGIFLLIISVSIVLTNISLTGAVIGIANQNNSFLYLISIAFLIAGVYMVITGNTDREYLERNSKLQEMLGDEKFESVPDEQRMNMNKSLRRYLQRKQKNEDYELKSKSKRGNGVRG